MQATTRRMAYTIEQYEEIQHRIRSAARRAGRDVQDVQLLAVSKRQSVSAMRRVASYGQQSFGENYLQEAEPKIDELQDLALQWHYIGQIQSNKTRLVAQLFDWVHSLDRLKIAQRLNDQRPDSATELNVFVEVNVSEEDTKGGVRPNEVADFIDALAPYKRLRVRGLMALPAPQLSERDQRKSFQRLNTIMSDLRQPQLNCLSMGTSSDFEAAINEGSTIVRIGTALFGPRA